MVQETDLLGSIFIKTESLEDYYETLKVIQMLVTSNDWVDHTTGYYINRVRGDLRISFFTSPSIGRSLSFKNRPIEIATTFMDRHGLEFSKPHHSPRDVFFSQHYGGEELQFRAYLATYSSIGFDILRSDRLNARCLFATLRLQKTLTMQSYKWHCRKTFESQSPAYNALAQEKKSQFWQDFSSWPYPAQIDWAHMFVNMVLGVDWDLRAFRPPQQARTIAEINEMLKEIAEQNFQIPDTWYP